MINTEYIFQIRFHLQFIRQMFVWTSNDQPVVYVLVSHITLNRLSQTDFSTHNDSRLS